MGLTRQEKEDKVKGDMNTQRPNKVTFRCCIEWDNILSDGKSHEEETDCCKLVFMCKEYEKVSDHLL